MDSIDSSELKIDIVFDVEEDRGSTARAIKALTRDSPGNNSR